MREEFGVLVGSDARQEWLLPWWWENFRRHNHGPVAFVDFGLSEAKRAWCRERGRLIFLRVSPLFVKEREEVDPSLVEEWERRSSETFWESREAWFKKPCACLQSPYHRTIWIDIDCELVGSLEALWGGSGVGLVKDFSACSPRFPVYNSGVIVFQKEDPLILEWANRSLEQNGLFRGDQDLLSHIIAEKKYPISELPPIYNWNAGYGKREDVVIYHWLGEGAKAALQSQLILAELED